MKRNTKTKSTKKSPRKATKPAARKKPTLAAAIRRIRAKNAAFRRMTPEQKRVAIAKDVLEQLAAKAILAQKGTYFSSAKVEKAINPYLSVFGRVKFWDDYTPTKHEQKALDTADNQVCDLLAGDAKCTVCGIGAAFVSAVRLGDDLKFKDLGSQDALGFDDTTMRDYLKRYFDPPQVALIECAFECDPCFHDADGCGASYSDACDAEEFGRKYESSSKRLAAIFENIIENKGTFSPPSVDDDTDAASEAL